MGKSEKSYGLVALMITAGILIAAAAVLLRIFVPASEGSEETAGPVTAAFIAAGLLLAVAGAIKALSVHSERLRKSQMSGEVKWPSAAMPLSDIYDMLERFFIVTVIFRYGRGIYEAKTESDFNRDSGIPYSKAFYMGGEKYGNIDELMSAAEQKGLLPDGIAEVIAIDGMDPAEFLKGAREEENAKG